MMTVQKGNMTFNLWPAIAKIHQQGRQFIDTPLVKSPYM
jgi:hypothetical protein